MGQNLFIFIDESGNHSADDCYVVAGIWCLTEYEDPSRIFQPTKDRISDNIASAPAGELKGSGMADSALNSVLVYLTKIFEMDDTITNQVAIWGNDQPVAYTLYDSDGTTGHSFSKHHLGEDRDAAVTAQLMSLISVSSPLLRIGDHRGADIESSSLVFDAECWKRAGTTFRSMVSTVERAPDVDFLYRDSRGTPGIQLADVAAHARRKRLSDGSCKRGTAAIDTIVASETSHTSLSRCQPLSGDLYQRIR